MKSIEIIICDDHAIFRDGIRTTLQQDENIEVLGEAENGVECLKLLKTKVPDIVLLDINMPILDGLETLKAIKSDFPIVKVLILTQYDEKRFVKQMMKLGADGYILKSTSRKEMLTAFNEVINNRIYLSDEAYQAVNNLYASSKTGLFTEFSKREKQILKLLCDGLSTKEIADDLSISFHTVETHRSNVMKKAGVVNIASLVKWAVQNEFD